MGFDAVTYAAAKGAAKQYTDQEITGIVPLSFTDVVVKTTDWGASTEYSGYEVEAVIACEGVTAGRFADVVFSHEDSLSYNYSPVCLAGAGTVTIYALTTPADDITIPLIRVVPI